MFPADWAKDVEFSEINGIWHFLETITKSVLMMGMRLQTQMRWKRAVLLMGKRLSVLLCSISVTFGL